MKDFGFPAPFQQRMQERISGEWEAFKLAHTTASPVSIRLNPKKEFQVLPGDPVPWTDFGRYLEKRPIFTFDPAFHAGAYYVQEASSMFLEQAIRQTVDLSAALKVLDLSAAPGGKSTHVLSLINDQSLLVSNEVIRSRASILSENIQKWGYPNCLVTNNDPADFSNLEGFFDLIIVDAPCSGEGLFRKDPSAMKEWSEDNVKKCALRQRRILHDVWPSLKKDGVLIYSTCTYNEMENENNLRDFSTELGCEFPELVTDPSWKITQIKQDRVTGYRFYPHEVKGEGFFLSVMKKTDSPDKVTFNKKTRLNEAEKKSADKIRNCVHEPARFNFFQHQDLIFFLPKSCVADVDFLLQHLRFVYTGTNAGTLKHDKLVPEHALALSTVLDRTVFNKRELDIDVALQYLRKETITLPDAERGYCLITFNSLPLGWVNILENRVNNMYPADWRIRMSQPMGNQ